MNRWLHNLIETLSNIPAARRHVYILAMLFLSAAAITRLQGEFGAEDANSAETQEVARLQEMAATAHSLYR